MFDNLEFKKARFHNVLFEELELGSNIVDLNWII